MQASEQGESNKNSVSTESNSTWKLILIPLLIINLKYFGALLQSTTSLYFGLTLFGASPQFLALLILDLVAASFYFNEKSNRIWKIIFILVFIINSIIFGFYLLGWFIAGRFKLGWLFENPPHVLGLLLVDLITVLSHVIQRYSQSLSRLEKGIIYTTLIAASLIVLAISFDPHQWFLVSFDNTVY